jgi:hypothetical protein
VASTSTRTLQKETDARTDCGYPMKRHGDVYVAWKVIFFKDFVFKKGLASSPFVSLAAG